MSDADCTILDCPNCQSHRAGIIASSPPQAKCSDCGALYSEEESHRGRVRADGQADNRIYLVRQALRWRPTFLAVVALSYSLTLGCKAAKVSPQTVINHRKADPEFDAQVIAAQAHCIDLLHSVAMRRVIEGDCEPIFWQGIEVGHIRKFDGRLQLEMLRAHMPAKFKTPGSGAAVAVNAPGGSVLVVTPEVQAELMAMRQEGLRAIEEKKAKALEV